MPETQLAPAPAADDNRSWTEREIAQQPETLRATQRLLATDRAGIEGFLAPLLARPELRIVLTGAGTSAFVGECLAPWLSAQLGRAVEAVPTTDIVSAPALYLRHDAPTLLVSFGRSGSSPESVAAVDLADAKLAEVHHLIITCNGDGALARRTGPRARAVVLPEATHDQAFAMTSSFTAMMLAALSIFTGIGETEARVEAIARGVAAMLAAAGREMPRLAGRGFDRVVYLGSGAFKGLAREAALKLLELTDGALVTAFDSPMGFRHGPKTIVNARTLMVVFVANDPLTRRYDLDIVEELERDGRAGAVLAICAGDGPEAALVVPDMADAADADLLFPFVIAAQLFALHASLALGLTPDKPNASGTVNRVVQGVRIHHAAA